MNPHFLNTLSRDFHLFLASPREYLYSYAYSATRKKTVRPFSHHAYLTGQGLVSQIKSALPGCPVYFIGSTGLQILGSGDIDIIVECSSVLFGQSLPKLISLYGPPQKSRSLFHEWSFLKNGHPVELSLIDPTSHEFVIRMQVFKVLSTNKIKLNQYARLLTGLNGKSEREYDKCRLLFFNHLISNKL
jgi:hypothetical protein